MPIVSHYQIEDLARTECKNEILLQTKIHTELHIISEEDKGGRTIIRFPLGNKFDIVDGCIFIKN